MVPPGTRRSTRLLFGTTWLVGGLFACGMPTVALAQQPNSQVLVFTGSIPGQPDGPANVRLRLFDASSGGTLLFEETQIIMVASQTFTTRIGDATAGGVPATLFQSNNSMWIALALDSAPDAEIGPRTALTSGGYAHAAALLSGPMVRTLNGLVGDVALAAGANVTITPSGNTVTIGAAGGGLAGVRHDGTLLGDGSGGAPLAVAAPLRLTNNSPYATIAGDNSYNVNGQGFGVSGNGATGVLGTGTFRGVAGEASGSGFGVVALSDSGTAMYAVSQSGAGVIASTLSTAASATGVSGSVTSATPGAYSAGVRGINNGTGGAGIGVYGSQNGAGWGVYGTAVSGMGVRGEATSGTGVFGQSGSGFGIYGASNTGYAGYFAGRVAVTNLDTAGTTPLCWTSYSALATCSSSLRYKTDVHPFSGGLDLVNRLRPIAFRWKKGGMRDIGLAAEDVAQVEPLLTFRNDKGEIEGVKYSQLSAVFVNAFVEQQAKIQRQLEEIQEQRARLTSLQRELAALKTLVCRSQPKLDACR